MARFPYSFRSKTAKDDPALDRALATNFDKAATDERVDAVVASVTGEAATRAAADTALDGRLDAIEADYLTSAEGDAAYVNVGGDTMTGDLTTGANASNRALVGSWIQNPAFAAAFQHAGIAAAADSYAIMQTSAGATFVGAKGGQSLFLRVANADIATVQANGITVAASKKVTQNAAPTTGDDLANKTYVDAGDAAAVPKSIGDAKGDLIGFSAADTPVRVAAAASNGSVFTSDTSQTGGVKWARSFRAIDTATGRATITTTGHYCDRAGAVPAYTTAGVTRGFVWIDPADYGSTSVIVKVQASVITETDPTDHTLNVSLVRATSFSGGALTGASAALVTASLTPNAANTIYEAVSGEYTLSTAGLYGVVFIPTVNPAQTATYGYQMLALTTS